MTEKYVYMFSQGNRNMRELLGGKGANLAEMTKIGIPVPQGFIVTTEVCNKYFEDGRKISSEIESQILQGVKNLEEITGKKFGDVNNPLLVSVRSGARASMPGMMDTVLSLGLNDEVVKGLGKLTNNMRFAYDCYRRFIQMFADVVMGYDKGNFEKILEDVKHKKGISLDIDLDEDDLAEIVDRFKVLYKENVGSEFPQEPIYQMLETIKAVFRSWDNPRAYTYRRMHNIPYSWGTAVNIQSMVFGNMGNDSGTGVAFTRNPATGEKAIYGEYLLNAQGEDVVAGIRTPNPISVLKKDMPKAYEEFENICKTLESNFKDMQDIEFTIEKGKLYILQTRNGKRTAHSALQIAVDLVEEGMIDEKQALMMIEANSLNALLHAQFDASSIKSAKVLASGLPASPGAASGKIAFTSQRAKEMAASGDKVVLVRLETSPEDIEGMIVSEGTLTARGGMTSHAAVVARGMGVACVAGCGEVVVEDDHCTIAGKEFKEGDVISFDGGTGCVYEGAIKTVPASLGGNFGKVMAWADKYRTLKIRANADTETDAKQAFEFGAEGIGLCRTEHMFFQGNRIDSVREMIVAQNVEDREKALEKIREFQKHDFVELFKTMDGKSVTIRFLDPPLHEFLPKTEEETADLAKKINMRREDLDVIVENLHEFNPMMGHRGLRLAVTYPEIAKAQTRAVLQAAIEVKKAGINTACEIMIPLTCESVEFEFVKNIVMETSKQVFAEENDSVDFTVGTMIEVPRAAVTADKIASGAEFFSFGTNDLTQMTFGFSRDDAAKFLNEYYQNKLLEFDPFEHVDENGVGSLIKIAIELGRKARPNIKLGVCGEHGGDPLSIDFFHRVGLNYVSCSPYRVPIAKLAAAQAAIKYNK